MGRACAVDGCQNNQTNFDGWNQLPKNELVATGLMKDYVKKKSFPICSAHFTRDSFEESGKGLRLLQNPSVINPVNFEAEVFVPDVIASFNNFKRDFKRIVVPNLGPEWAFNHDETKPNTAVYYTIEYNRECF